MFPSIQLQAAQQATFNKKVKIAVVSSTLAIAIAIAIIVDQYAFNGSAANFFLETPHGKVVTGIAEAITGIALAIIILKKSKSQSQKDRINIPVSNDSLMNAANKTTSLLNNKNKSHLDSNNSSPYSSIKDKNIEPISLNLSPRKNKNNTGFKPQVRLEIEDNKGQNQTKNIISQQNEDKPIEINQQIDEQQIDEKLQIELVVAMSEADNNNKLKNESPISNQKSTAIKINKSFNIDNKQNNNSPIAPLQNNSFVPLPLQNNMQSPQMNQENNHSSSQQRQFKSIAISNDSLMNAANKTTSLLNNKNKSHLDSNNSSLFPQSQQTEDNLTCPSIKDKNVELISLNLSLKENKNNTGFKPQVRLEIEDNKGQNQTKNIISQQNEDKPIEINQQIDEQQIDEKLQIELVVAMSEADNNNKLKNESPISNQKSTAIKINKSFNIDNKQNNNSPIAPLQNNSFVPLPLQNNMQSPQMNIPSVKFTDNEISEYKAFVDNQIETKQKIENRAIEPTKLIEQFERSINEIQKKIVQYENQTKNNQTSPSKYQENVQEEIDMFKTEIQQAKNDINTLKQLSKQLNPSTNQDIYQAFQNTANGLAPFIMSHESVLGAKRFTESQKQKVTENLKSHTKQLNKFKQLIDEDKKIKNALFSLLSGIIENPIDDRISAIKKETIEAINNNEINPQMATSPTNDQMINEQQVLSMNMNNNSSEQIELDLLKPEPILQDHSDFWNEF